MFNRTESIPAPLVASPHQPIRGKIETSTTRRNHRKRSEPHDVPIASVFINPKPHRQSTKSSSASQTSLPTTGISHRSPANSLLNRSLKSWGSFLAVGLALSCFGGAIFAPTHLFGRQNSRSAHKIITNAIASAFNGGSSAVRIAVVAPLQEKSPLGPEWSVVLPHIAQRMEWQEPEIQLRIIDSALITHEIADKNLIFQGDDIVIALGITNPNTVDALLPAVHAAPTFAALGSADVLKNAVRMAGISISLEDPAKQGGFAGLLASLQALFVPGAATAQRHAHAYATMQELYTRKTSDDLLFSLLVVVNEAVRPVAAVSNSTKRGDAGLDAVSCMIGNCAKEMFQCFTDATCRTALDCMNGCAFNDQVRK